MIFRKLKAAFGAGVDVDTVLQNAQVRPGDLLRGQVNFRSESTDYSVDAITLDLIAEVEVESGDSEYKTNYSFSRTTVASRFKLAAGSAQSIPFEIPVPWETPISAVNGQPLRGMKLGVKTELELAGSLDKGDLDPLFVNPLPAQERFMRATDQLGFGFKKADLEKGTLVGSQMPFFQEIEYYASREFRGSFNELEVTFIASPSAVDVILEVDKRGAFGGSHDAYDRFTMGHQDQGDFAGALRNRLNALANKRKGLFG
ncbi:sporulation protein [Rhizohabitans arisaemae]|uniref:sporulation protein n=1 Tax=Rhizohabitans arisaemae TaxID=2720610 RepID=UPI0024B0B306|nr:sporulation protein [Rhizohabitans arisaemae]